MKKAMQVAAVISLTIFLTGATALANSGAKKSHKKGDCASCCCDMKSGTKSKEAKASPTTSKNSVTKKDADKK